MVERTIQASTFKAQCLGLLDDVARSHISVVITKHGRPVARLVPIEDAAAGLEGSVTLVADDDEDYFSTGERWVAG